MGSAAPGNAGAGWEVTVTVRLVGVKEAIVFKFSDKSVLGPA